MQRATTSFPSPRWGISTASSLSPLSKTESSGRTSPGSGPGYVGTTVSSASTGVPPLARFGAMRRRPPSGDVSRSGSRRLLADAAFGARAVRPCRAGRSASGLHEVGRRTRCAGCRPLTTGTCTGATCRASRCRSTSRCRSRTAPRDRPGREGGGAGLLGAGMSGARPGAGASPAARLAGGAGSPESWSRSGGEPAVRVVRAGQTPQLGADQDRLVRPSTWVWSSWPG